MAEEDLFGSESEPESTPEPKAAEEPAAAEPTKEEEEESSSELVVEVAELPTPRESATLHTLKLPASLRVVPEPFDAAWHVPDASAASAAIRWRYGNASTRESNARLVRWADGSLQLFVGGVAHDVAPSELPGDVRLGVKFRGVVHCHGSVRSKLAVQPPSNAASSSAAAASASAAPSAAAKARVRLIEVENDPEMEQPHKAKLEAQRSSAFGRRGRAASSGLSAAMLEDTSSGGGNAPLRRSAADDATEAAASKRLLDAKAPHPQQRPQQRPRKF